MALLTPSSGLVTEPRTNPNLQHCDECGEPMQVRSLFPRPGMEWRCKNYECPRCAFQRAPVDTSFAGRGWN